MKILFICILFMSLLYHNQVFSCQLESQGGTIEPVKIPSGVGIFVPIDNKVALLSCGLNITAYNPPYPLIKINRNHCFTATQGDQRILYQCSNTPPQGTDKCWVEYGEKKIMPEIIKAGTGRIVQTKKEEILVNCGTFITAFNKDIRMVKLVVGQCGIVINEGNMEFFQCQ